MVASASVHVALAAYGTAAAKVVPALEKRIWVTLPAISVALRVRVTWGVLVDAAPAFTRTVPVGGVVSGGGSVWKLKSSLVIELPSASVELTR